MEIEKPSKKFKQNCLKIKKNQFETNTLSARKSSKITLTVIIVVRHRFARRKNILRDAVPLGVLVVLRLHLVLVRAHLRDPALDVAGLGVPSPHQLGVPHGGGGLFYTPTTLQFFLATFCGGRRSERLRVLASKHYLKLYGERKAKGNLVREIR